MQSMLCISFKYWW